MTATVPRSRTGTRLHHLGTDVYAVAIDSMHTECSERHPGDVWCTIIRPGDWELLFMDSYGATTSTFHITRLARAPRVGIYIDGDLVHLIDITTGYLDYGDTINVNWSTMYEVMA